MSWYSVRENGIGLGKATLSWLLDAKSFEIRFLIHPALDETDSSRAHLLRGVIDLIRCS